MKKTIVLLVFIISLCGCAKNDTTTTTNEVTYNNQGLIDPVDDLGGGKESTIPSLASFSTTDLENVISNITLNESQTYDTKTDLTDSFEITLAGNYYLTGTINSTVKVKAEGVHLFLENATLATAGKVIDCKYDTIITLIGENSITNTTEKNAISSDEGLTINGAGKLSITSLKNGIKCENRLDIINANISIDSDSNGISTESVYIKNATLDINTENDGIHAEIDYDDVTEAPTFSYEKGFVYIINSDITIEVADNGINADSFVMIDKGEYEITTNGGAPAKITEVTQENASGDGIKVSLDYIIGEDEFDLVTDKFAIVIKDGTFNLNTNDDALKSDGNLLIDGGTLTVNTGSKGINVKCIAQINSGTIKVLKSYEGLEASKLQISGGTLTLYAIDDGINASDGTDNAPGVSNTNCHIIINGGTLMINANGDGIDSNGSVLISGGEIALFGPLGAGNSALDSDGGIIVTGGKIFTCGCIGMVETPSKNSTQNVISIATKDVVSENSIIKLVNANGDVIMEYTVPKRCQSIIISSPDIKLNETYTLYQNETVLGTINITGIITSSGSTQNPGPRK